MTQRIVRTGKWLYDGTVYKGVYIVEAKYSPWDNTVDDDLGDFVVEDQPELHGDGLCYYVCFDRVPSELPVPADSPGFSSMDDASAHAESRVPTPITWEPNRAA